MYAFNRNGRTWPKIQEKAAEAGKHPQDYVNEIADAAKNFGV